MGAEVEKQQSNSLDAIKWLFGFAILLAAVVGNYMYGEQVSVLWRALGVVAAVAVALFVLGQTAKGQQAMLFAKDSRTEVRKVVWPTRQETTQTTIIVIIATLIMSLILWGLDSILMRLVAIITGWEF